MKICAKNIEDYEIARRDLCSTTSIYPYVRNDEGTLSVVVISPNHGRSFLLNKLSDFHWTIGKGNGLCYSTHKSLINSSHEPDTWGRLSLQHALRDFDIGNEIANLGIKTNRMEYVIKLPFKVVFNGIEDNAALLQYSVECPYRIVDFGFIPKDLLKVNVSKWLPIKKSHLDAPKHIIAADRLFYNLSLLHRNGILHNAITTQNYTWALELLDFEASHTPNITFGTEQYRSYIPMLMDMEVIQTYEIVNYIAWCLNETPNYKMIEQILKSYGFNLKPCNL